MVQELNSARNGENKKSNGSSRKAENGNIFKVIDEGNVLFMVNTPSSMVLKNPFDHPPCGPDGAPLRRGGASQKRRGLSEEAGPSPS